MLRLELGREPRLGGGTPGPVVGAAVSSLRKVGDLSCQRKPGVDLGEKGLLAEVQPHPHQEMEERWGEGTKAPPRYLFSVEGDWASYLILGRVVEGDLGGNSSSASREPKSPANSSYVKAASGGRSSPVSPPAEVTQLIRLKASMCSSHGCRVPLF